jgi:hypothetical protein
MFIPRRVHGAAGRDLTASVSCLTPRVVGSDERRAIEV